MQYVLWGGLVWRECDNIDTCIAHLPELRFKIDPHSAAEHHCTALGDVHMALLVFQKY